MRLTAPGAMLPSRRKLLARLTGGVGLCESALRTGQCVRVRHVRIQKVPGLWLAELQGAHLSAAAQAMFCGCNINLTSPIKELGLLGSEALSG